MKKFNQYHEAVIRNYVELNKYEALSYFTEDEIEFLNNSCSEYEEEDEGLLNFEIASAVTDDMMKRLYQAKKTDGTLNHFLDRFEFQCEINEMPPELSLVYDFMGRQYEENAIFTVYYALEEYHEMIQNNELWKLFEDESSTNIFMPVAI